MKLFSIRTLSATILLSSTVLLSACGGNSDSSGGKYEFKDKSKLDVLNGYWQSNCEETDEGSAFLYLALQKVSGDLLAMNGKVQFFLNKDCTGNKFIVKINKKPKPIKKDALEADKSIKIIDNDHWMDPEDGERFTRISENDYKKIR